MSIYVPEISLDPTLVFNPDLVGENVLLFPESAVPAGFLSLPGVAVGVAVVEDGLRIGEFMARAELTVLVRAGDEASALGMNAFLVISAVRRAE